MPVSPLQRIEINTPADAVEVDSNYQKLQNHINQNLIDKNGSVAMTQQLTLVGDPKQNNHAANKRYVDNQMPIGVIMPFAGNAAPGGDDWALCNGAAKSKADFLDLFNVIGYRYGGSGGTFKLPDLQGRIPIGVQTGVTRFAEAGKTGGNWEVPVPEHVHTMTHDHPLARTGMEAAHTHSHPHTHPIDHEHTGKYSGYATPAAGGLWLNTRAADGGTAAVMTADQSGTDSGSASTNTTSAGSEHDHAFNVANFIGDTGAFKKEINIDDDPVIKTTTEHVPPYVVIQYIIRVS